jgi:apolipoprotein N-acyltransferase
VRSTNAGITNIIDPNGRIISQLPPFIEGSLVGAVPVHRGAATLYTRWGDWLPWVLLSMSILAVMAGTIRRAFGRRNPRN